MCRSTRWPSRVTVRSNGPSVGVEVGVEVDERPAVGGLDLRSSAAGRGMRAKRGRHKSRRDLDSGSVDDRSQNANGSSPRCDRRATQIGSRSESVGGGMPPVLCSRHPQSWAAYLNGLDCTWPSITCVVRRPMAGGNRSRRKHDNHCRCKTASTRALDHESEPNEVNDDLATRLSAVLKSMMWFCLPVLDRVCTSLIQMCLAAGERPASASTVRSIDPGVAGLGQLFTAPALECRNCRRLRRRPQCL